VAAASSHSTFAPLAVGIAVGGACIGLGLYFGLRSRAPASPEVSSLGAPMTATAGVATAATTTAHAPVAEVDVAAARAEVARQLETARASLRDKCWAPSLARTPTPDRASFTYQYTFDGTGQQIARGIASDAGKARADVAFCLTGATPSVTIAPQGTTVRLTLSFALP
jgi:hypothetical protein